MLGAVSKKLFGTDLENSVITRICSTGNCKFTTLYQSLECCSRCSNVSPHIYGTLQENSLTVETPLAKGNGGSSWTLANYDGSMWLTANLSLREFQSSAVYYQGVNLYLNLVALNIGRPYSALLEKPSSDLHPPLISIMGTETNWLAS